MKTLIKRQNIPMLIAILEIIVGAFFLGKELCQITSLPSNGGLDADLGSADIIKYREDTYGLMFLWFVLLFTGLSYWISQKLFWCMCHVLLILSLLIVGGSFYFYVSPDFPLSIILASLIILSTFILLEFKRYNSRFKLKIGVNNTHKFLAIFLGISCALFYWFLKIMF